MFEFRFDDIFNRVLGNDRRLLQSFYIGKALETMANEVTLKEFRKVSKEQLPLVDILGFEVEALEHGKCVTRAIYKEDFLRPGGTISGPVLMALADYAMWGAIMSRAEQVQMALTTNLNINFLARPEPGDIIAVAKVMKMGKRLAVGAVDLFGNCGNELVAHVTCTYSLPPEKTSEKESL